MSTKWKPYFYGTKLEEKLEFSIVFGVNQRRIDRRKPLDRYELDTIASWLTGHEKYLWLEIEQDDLEYVRYKCVITGLEMIEYGNIPWALKATVTCDSPYAYMYPQSFEYKVNGEECVCVYNESSYNGYYMPVVDLTLSDTNNRSFSVTNLSDHDRLFSFDGVPTTVHGIHVDNDAQVITEFDGYDKDDNPQYITGTNLYPYFKDYQFLRLVKGENILKLSGNGTVRITCEFPINVGG